MKHRFVRCLLVALMALGYLLAPASRLAAQDPTPAPLPYASQVDALIAGMSVQQRVGQLFVVGFPGSDIQPGSDIADLIINYHIGGVQLRATNSNFDNAQTEPSPPQQIAQMANALQTLAMTRPLVNPVDAATPAPESTDVTPAASIATSVPTNTPAPPLPALPLFIALSPDVDTRPRVELSEVTQNVTQLPSQMANGATWRPENARISGEIFGREYAQMGINVLFGPMLDVVDVPKPNTPGDLGVGVFGGDPFWVGRMGAAFVAGVHRGSENRIAVVAKNFPGLGSSDRDVREEIPTVQKSLEQLKQIELAPFFAVMRGNVVDEAIVDGLLVSHIRYRGFQGNIRASTRPVSLDPQAYQALMALPETSAWRDSGGVTFSDSLGARSVRRFYDPLETSFNARRIAQEAFVAGNDVLVLDNFGLSREWPEQLANIKDALRFFQTRYVEDPNFAARVDESLSRILSLKLRLNGGNLNLNSMLVDDDAAGQMPLQTSAVNNIAKQAITLLSPNPRDLPSVLPNAPTKGDSIVFISDDRQLRDCQQCEPYPAVPKTALEELALNLYGPRTTGQVDPARVSSFTFSDLIDYNAQTSAAIAETPAATPDTLTPDALAQPTPLDATPQAPQPLRIQTAIERSTWIVIAMIDTNPIVTPTQALRTFLSQSADTLKDKRVIVFALGAPYYLDATEISKITAYFGVYSRHPSFLEAALRALFGEYVARGKSPVSVPALNYSLINVTAPDPAQIIPLTAGDTQTSTQATPEPLVLNTGDRLRLRAGPVVDMNGNLVPDGTQVQFVLSYPAERVEQRQDGVSTRDGIAETTIALERQGKLEIRAEADPALTSYVVRVDTGSTTQIETIRPTPAPTETPAPAPTVERPTAAPTAAPTVMPDAVASPPRASITGFLLTFIGLLLIGFSMFAVLAQEALAGIGLNTRLRVAIGVWVMGWLIYAVAAMGLPGTRWVTNMLGWAGSAVFAILLTLVAAALIFAGLRAWRRTQDKIKPTSTSQELRP